MVVEPCSACARNGYPNSGINIATKSLGSFRASSLRRPCSSSWSLTNFLNCIRGQMTLSLAHVDARWMAIAYGIMKLDGCSTLSHLWKIGLSQKWDEPCDQFLGELKTNFSSPPVLKFAEYDKPFGVHKKASDLPMADCWWKMDGHCIWEHEARLLSKKTTNSWQRTY